MVDTEIASLGPITIAGHSLGGHLATALTLASEQAAPDASIRGLDVAQTYTYNGLGLGFALFGLESVGAAFLQALELIILGLNFDQNHPGISNFYATAGLDIVPNVGRQFGPSIPLFSEDQEDITGISDHYMEFVTDAVSVYRIIDRLSPITVDNAAEGNMMRVHHMLAAASPMPTESFSSFLTSLGKLLQIDPSFHDIERAEEFYNALGSPLANLDDGQLYRISPSVDPIMPAAYEREHVKFGTDGDDRGATALEGGKRADYLFGRGGDDTLIGNDGEDWPEGNDGADRLEGGDNVDVLYGGDGVDTLIGGHGIDRLHAGEGDDVLCGVSESGEDDNAADELYGGVGFDTYHVGFGDVVIDIGGAGVIQESGVAAPVSGLVETYARSGLFTNQDPMHPISFRLLSDGSTLQAIGSYFEIRDFSDGDFRISLSGGPLAPVIDHTIVGTGDPDRLSPNGMTGNLEFQGLDGTDFIGGCDGDDVANTGPGNDTINGGLGKTTSCTAKRAMMMRLAVPVTNTNDAPIVANAMPDRNARRGLTFHYQIPEERIQDLSAGAVLLESQVQQLVQVMAAYAAPTGSESSLPPDVADAVEPVIAQVWSASIATTARVALVDIGNGLVYDDVLDITWTQPELEPKTWAQAHTWVASLTLGGVSGWRLPYISVRAGGGPVASSVINDCRIFEKICRDNELAYMFNRYLKGAGRQFSPARIIKRCFHHYGPIGIGPVRCPVDFSLGATTFISARRSTTSVSTFVTNGWFTLAISDVTVTTHLFTALAGHRRRKRIEDA